MKNVFAVIVTFNRPERLQACLSSLVTQQKFGLNRIHVVVNSPDARTIEVINSFDDGDLVTYQKYDNPGPAGGFAYGLRKFLSADADYAWLMDDDIIVDPLCLQELMKCTDQHEYVLPKVNKESGEEVVSYGWWGVLVSRGLVLKTGLPIPELFFWAEDTEYLQHRMVYRHGVKPFRCKEAVVNHLHLRSNKRPSWYYYYVIRNTIYYRMFITGYSWRRLSRTVYLFVQSVARILTREENKWRKLRLMAYGTYHGVKGKIGKLVDPALNK